CRRRATDWALRRSATRSTSPAAGRSSAAASRARCTRRSRSRDARRIATDDEQGGTTMKRRTLLQGTGALLAAGPIAIVHAQGFPTKPLRYIVPVAPGGGSDMVARTVCERWGRQLGQTFVVENHGG